MNRIDRDAATKRALLELQISYIAPGKFYGPPRPFVYPQMHGRSGFQPELRSPEQRQSDSYGYQVRTR